MDDHETPVYHTSLLSTVLPDLAHRLDPARHPAPANPAHARKRYADLRTTMQGQDLRDWVGSYLEHSSVDRIVRTPEGADVPTACDEISRIPANGNVVAIALDRLAPPTDASRDFVARGIHEVGRHRFPDARTPIDAWSPGFQDYSRAR